MPELVELALAPHASAGNVVDDLSVLGVEFFNCFGVGGDVDFIHTVEHLSSAGGSTVPGPGGVAQAGGFDALVWGVQQRERLFSGAVYGEVAVNAGGAHDQGGE